jgi:predicted nuclease of predicted toxin-antitoxin system
VAGRFPLYTDADIHGPLIVALHERGWDLVRAIDSYPAGTADEVHFERAAREKRVLISNDRDMEVIANRWLAHGRSFRGLILWPQEHYKRMGYAELVAEIEALSEPFPHPVMHLKPRAE